MAIEDDGRTVVILRRDGKGYGFPFGKLDEGETPAEAAARELREETGYRVQPSDLIEILSENRYFICRLFALRPGAPFERGAPEHPEECEVILSPDPVPLLGDPANRFRDFNLRGLTALRAFEKNARA